ncbi:hypothetical protein B0J12DRAFT_401134 [Macrophomina phaseolina]|uniref:Uncharacterized protein n=1 Tax=Macrophomina phaseolina TaxID=35725 RepID=A0ABQ8GIF7_9PEZI|nr:hypothetical protein B0J12DRAFT_401134 [Macrophomina phaseolina]
MRTAVPLADAPAGRGRPPPTGGLMTWPKTRRRDCRPRANHDGVTARWQATHPDLVLPLLLPNLPTSRALHTFALRRASLTHPAPLPPHAHSHPPRACSAPYPPPPSSPRPPLSAELPQRAGATTSGTRSQYRAAPCWLQLLYRPPVLHYRPPDSPLTDPGVTKPSLTRPESS